MRLLLHIGLHKTGTSSLQGYALREAEFLLRQGIYCPSHLEGKRAPNKSDLYQIIQHDIRSGTHRAKAVFDTWRHEAEERGAHTILVSGETLCRLRARPRRLLRKAIGAMETTVFIVFRNQSRHKISVVSEAMKRPNHTYSSERIIMRFPGMQRTDKLIEDWEDDFGVDHVSVGFYDSGNRDQISDFLRWLEVDMAGASTDMPRINIGIPLYVQTAALWNGLWSTGDNQRKVISACAALPKPKHRYGPADLLMIRTIDALANDSWEHPKLNAFRDRLTAPLQVDLSPTAALERQRYTEAVFESLNVADFGAADLPTLPPENIAAKRRPKIIPRALKRVVRRLMRRLALGF